MCAIVFNDGFGRYAYLTLVFVEMKRDLTSVFLRISNERNINMKLEKNYIVDRTEVISRVLCFIRKICSF